MTDQPVHDLIGVRSAGRNDRRTVIRWAAVLGASLTAVGMAPRGTNALAPETPVAGGELTPPIVA